MTRCGGMATLVGREATSGTEKGGDDVTWTDANFTGLKNEKKIYAVNSAITNE
jgi:hypothetical protein